MCSILKWTSVNSLYKTNTIYKTKYVFVAFKLFQYNWNLILLLIFINFENAYPAFVTGLLFIFDRLTLADIQSVFQNALIWKSTRKCPASFRVLSETEQRSCLWEIPLHRSIHCSAVISCIHFKTKQHCTAVKK